MGNENLWRFGCHTPCHQYTAQRLISEATRTQRRGRNTRAHFEYEYDTMPLSAIHVNNHSKFRPQIQQVITFSSFNKIQDIFLIPSAGISLFLSTSSISEQPLQNTLVAEPTNCSRRSYVQLTSSQPATDTPQML